MLNATEYLHLAADAMSRNEHHPALIYLKEASALDPNSAQVRYGLSSLYLKIGMVQPGLEQLERCLDLEPNNEMLRLRLAGLHRMAGKIEEAKNSYLRLARSEDGVVSAYSDAVLHLLDGRSEAASECLRRGLSAAAEAHPLREDLHSLLYTVFASNSAQDPGTAPVATTTPQTNAYLGAYAKSYPVGE